MAKCDQGYLCRVCGSEVETLSDSALYLRYVIGEIDPETLHLSSECHLRCNPVLAQFICDERFENPPLAPEGFGIQDLDAKYAATRKELITRGYRRLLEIQSNRKRFPHVQDYVLEVFQGKWK